MDITNASRSTDGWFRSPRAQVTILRPQRRGGDDGGDGDVYGAEQMQDSLRSTSQIRAAVQSMISSNSLRQRSWTSSLLPDQFRDRRIRGGHRREELPAALPDVPSAVPVHH